MGKEITRPVSAGLHSSVPALYAPTAQAAKRFIEYFAANIRDPNSRRAYFHAVLEFSSWCEAQNFTQILDIEPLHVAAYIEQLTARLATPSVNQHPAALVRGPKYTVRKGKTPVLAQEEARELLDAIDTSTVVGLRDRALIATMIYTFGRVGAVIKMRGEDYYTQGRRGWVRLHEKGGKRHEMPCNHNLEAYLDAYISAAGLAGDLKGYLFRSTRSRTRQLTTNPLAQADVYRMIRRRAFAAGIKTRIGNHTFRATGITQYLRNGGRRELAQQMEAHESPRTTALYDRRDEEAAVDEVERILI